MTSKLELRSLSCILKIPKLLVSFGIYIRNIFSVRHFQKMIRRKERLKERPVADPFVIARAKCLENGCVVTTEKHKPNSAQIPNVCEYFGVDWTDLEGFMEREQWRF